MKRLASALALAFVAIVAMVTACTQPAPPVTPSLTVSPAAVSVTAGGAAQTFTATLQNATDTIFWSLSGNGSLSTNTGPSTNYTPPAAVAAVENATLTATAGTLTASASITIDPPAAPATITVSGSVLRFNGDPASGINVQIDDAAGLTLSTLSSEIDPTATDPSGNFTIAGVTPPYTLSVIPPVLNEVPQTWTGVTRSDPIVVINPFTGAATFCPTPAPGTINVTLTNPVGAGNTGEVVFIAEGIDHLEIYSNAWSAFMPPGNSAVAINVPFDPSLCKSVISGKLIYFERNVSGAIVNTGTANVTVATGNVVAAQITVLTGTTRSLAGNVNFPVGTTDGVVFLVLKVGGASALIEAQGVTTVDPDYDIAAPELPGVEYRSLVISGSFIGNQIQWAYSGVLTLPALNVNLQLPSLGETITPAGSIGTDATPTFRYVQITGTNLNYAYFEDDPFSGTVQWIGATQATSITLPELPAPARLTAGTMVVPNYYLWA
ncbi:MAG: hypothetical protein R6W77_08250, partial [Trueperaceae bacterium]